MSNVKTVGILYHPKLNEAMALAEKLIQVLRSFSISAWFCSAWEEQTARNQLDDSEFIISIGGDGTILRTARVVLSHSIPILGINLGRLGFMTELNANEAVQSLSALLSGKGWIDERAMLQASSAHSGRTFHALNDVVVGRGAIARAMSVDVNIDGVDFTTYRVDAVILATATGSTAYALAAGGPVLHPESQNILLQPVATHLGLGYGLVLPAAATIRLTAHVDYPATLSIDGQNNPPLGNGEQIEVKHSPFLTRFLRLKPRGSFYSALAQRLVGK
jgi:NAD+ kinase